VDVVTGGALVVVGVDGSTCSKEALRFAVDEARMRGARLRIVTAWSIPPLTYTGGAGAMIDPAVFEQDARATLDEALAEAHRIGDDLEIDSVIANESAAAALLSASGEADLVVVGSRGHGGFTSLLLGSVSHQVALHASCPVTIIHARG
jgi:nucleotide-binding universal stress UspA family protein